MGALAALCAKQACWTFLLMLFPGNGEHTSISGQTMDRAECVEWAKDAKKRYGHEKDIDCYLLKTAALAKEMQRLIAFDKKRRAEFMAKQAWGAPPVPAKPRPRGIRFAGEGEADYQKRQHRCLATAIYFEARGESIKGQYAVAQVVMTRVRSSLYPDTICGVVYQGERRRTGCQFSFTCDGKPDVPKNRAKWIQAEYIARQVTGGAAWLGDIGYATNYHANYVSPKWKHELTRVKQIGAHIFYRVKGAQIRDMPGRGA